MSPYITSHFLCSFVSPDIIPHLLKVIIKLSCFYLYNYPFSTINRIKIVIHSCAEQSVWIVIACNFISNMHFHSNCESHKWTFSLHFTPFSFVSFIWNNFSALTPDITFPTCTIFICPKHISLYPQFLHDNALKLSNKEWNYGKFIWSKPCMTV